MTDQEKNLPNDEGNGKKPVGDERTFTQSEVNVIVQDRLARERKQYDDYDEAKAKATKWDEYDKSQKTEAQKAIEDKEAAERRAEAAMNKANQRLIQAEFISVASGLGVAHPEDAFALSDRSTVEISDDGKVSGVEPLVKLLVDSGRLPLTGKPKAPGLDGGAGDHDRKMDKEPELSPEELSIARKMNLTPDEYRKYKEKE